MTPSEKYLKKLGLTDDDNSTDQSAAPGVETENSRRSFFKKGGIALGSALALSSIEDVIAQSTQKVSRFSAPSDLRITDMRYCLTGVMGGTAIIRIDTNQGIYG